MIVERYQPILSSIWQDEKFRKFTDDKKILWFYLLTCPNSNMLGLYFLPEGYILSDLKWLAKRFGKPFRELLDGGLIDYDFDSQIILVNNKVKHNKIDNENQAKAAAKIIVELPNTFLFKAFHDIFEPFAEPYHKPLLEGLVKRYAKSVAVSRKPLAVSRKPLAEDKHKHSVANPGGFDDGMIRAIVDPLMAKIKVHRPNHQITNSPKTIRLMITKDKHDPKEMAALVEWYPIGEQYIPEIFSIKSFREKYEKLLNAYNRLNDQNGPKRESLEDLKIKNKDIVEREMAEIENRD